MICKVPYRLLFPLLAWHGVKIILRDERLFNVGLSWSVFQGHVFPFPVLYFCNMTYEYYYRSKRQLESFFSILSKGNNLLKIVWNIQKFVIRLHLYKIKVGHEYISWIHTSLDLYPIVYHSFSQLFLSTFLQRWGMTFFPHWRKSRDRIISENIHENLGGVYHEWVCTLPFMVPLVFLAKYGWLHDFYYAFIANPLY